MDSILEDEKQTKQTIVDNFARIFAIFRIFVLEVDVLMI